MSRRLTLAALVAVAGCGEPTDITVPEPEIRSSSGISLDGMSFVFPVGLELEGAIEPCDARASECPLADDSVHLAWRAGGLRFDYVVDHFGAALPGSDWGQPITINGKPAFRKQLDDGAKRYLITNHYGGEDSAAAAIWQQEEQPLFWGTCRNDEDCEAVLQTLASVSMRSAESECAIMFPKPPPEWVPPPGYRPGPAPFPTPQAPRPDPEALASRPPPPPPLPHDAQALCKDYIDAS